MSTPVNIWCPCDGDAFDVFDVEDPFNLNEVECDCCSHASWHGGKCLADHGWPILAAAAAEVARERGGKR